MNKKQTKPTKILNYNELIEQAKENLERLQAFDEKCQAERKAEKVRLAKERKARELKDKKSNLEFQKALRDLAKYLKVNCKPNKNVWGNDILAN